MADPVSESAYSRAIDAIRRGGVVAFPTETYYGLAADPDCEEAVKRIFNLKGRRWDKPLLLLIEKIQQLQMVADSIPWRYQPLIDNYWPGPLTLIFPAKDSVNKMVTAGGGSVGVRISSHPVARELVARMGKPLTATSANISGRQPAESAREVELFFGTSLDMILDGGLTTGGLCSTIVGLQDDKLTVFRQGQIILPP